MNTSETDEKKLRLLWREITVLVGHCTGAIRKRKYCEDAVMRITLETGSRVHVYSIPSDANSISSRLLFEPDQKKSKSTKSSSNPEALRNLGQIDHDLRSTTSDVVFSTIKTMSMADLRRLCSHVREHLNMKQFVWPSAAQIEYKNMKNEDPPPPPGRVGCTKDRLRLILSLSAIHDETWKEALSLSIHQYVPGEYEKDNGRPKNPSNAFELHSHDRDNSQKMNMVLCKTRSRQLTESNSTEDWPSWWPSRSDEILTDILCIANELPKDTFRVLKPKKDWLNLSNLSKGIQLGSSAPISGTRWSVQKTPGDGNCMFSAVMIAAYSRHVVSDKLRTVSGLRKVVKDQLEDLCFAGKLTSSFRREWLASCMHDMDDSSIKQFCERATEQSEVTYRSKHVEALLLPLRIFVKNWSSMLGNDHWGGILSVELTILSTITGCAIEVMREVKQYGPGVERFFDFRHGGKISLFERAGLYAPSYATLPSSGKGYLDGFVHGSTESGWVGHFPLLRIVLSNRHYSACVCSGYSPIPHDYIGTQWNGHDQMRTLSEPYADLSVEEIPYFKKGSRLIEVWKSSREDDMLLTQVDHVVSSTQGQQILISQLSQLENVPFGLQYDESDYMLGSDIITGYMDLLRRRNELLIGKTSIRGLNPPEKSYYMNAYFYSSLDRGRSGPSSSRPRSDLKQYSRILIPVNTNNHWLLAVCYLHESVIGIYDPLGFRREDVFRKIKEWADRKLPREAEKSWSFFHLIESRGEIQKSVVDCGVYVCKAAESIGLGAAIRICQWDIEYVRRRMLTEFIRDEATPLSLPIGRKG